VGSEQPILLARLAGWLAGRSVIVKVAAPPCVKSGPVVLFVGTVTMYMYVQKIKIRVCVAFVSIAHRIGHGHEHGHGARRVSASAICGRWFPLLMRDAGAIH
jgi:hypothetical protein